MPRKKHVLPKRAKDLTGQKFGRWTVLGWFGKRQPSSGSLIWRCRCDCGTELDVVGASLRNSISESCGCLRSELISQRFRKHGQAKIHGAKAPTIEYTAWAAMIDRCETKSNRAYRRYGGRGIRVCGRWRKDFEAFFTDMGLRPSDEHSLDRRNNEGHYSCGKCDECTTNGWDANCRWATEIEQARNRSSRRTLTHQGQTLCLSEWAEKTGISKTTIRERIRMGWSVDRSLATPVRTYPRTGTDE